MKRTYQIHAAVRGAKYLGEVDAESAQEALEIAQKELDLSARLCHQCSSECDDPEVVFISAEHQLENGEYETAEEDLT